MAGSDNSLRETNDETECTRVLGAWGRKTMTFEMFKEIVPAAYLVRLAKYCSVDFRVTMLKS